MSDPKPNGQEPTGSERLDRIERALELLPNDRILFREEHKQLLTSQVLLNGQLERLSASVDKMRENFDARLKRLEA